MADISSKSPATTYKDLLTVNVSTDNEGLETSLKRVSDGEGVNSSIELSSNDLNVSTHNGSSTGLKLGGTLVTSTAAELNVLDGIASIDTDISSVSSNNDTLASAKAIKTYIDAQDTAADLDMTSDSGSGAIDLDSETLTIAGGEGIDTGISSNTITISGEDATTSNKGVASFNSAHFSLSSGAVSIGTDTIDDTLIDFGTGSNQVNTDDLPEGSSNLYFTNERVDDRVGSIATAGEGIDIAYDDSAGTVTFSGEDATSGNKGIASFSSSHFSVSSGAVSIATDSIDDTLIDFGTGTNQVSTADVPENTNLYYTDTRVRANRLDQMTAPTGSVSFNSQKITSLATPTASGDAASKSYVDSVAQGLNVHDACAIATTANITLSGEQTIDGVTSSTDRVLVKNQSTGSENGIYVSASGSWARASDMNAADEVASSFVFVTGGTANADTGWVCTNEPESVTIGTDAITWSQFSDAGHITEGTGLTKSGNTLSVDTGIGNNKIVKVDDSDAADNDYAKLTSSGVEGRSYAEVKTDLSLNNVENTAVSSWAGTSNITTLGTVGTGTWQGDAVAVGYGGTGATSLTDGGVLLGSGSGAITAMSVLSDGEMIVGDGSGDPVAESGATLRTSIGVGTGDSPQFTGIELGHASDTTIARSGSGDITIEGNAVYRAGGTDVAVADGGTGVGTLTDGGVLLGSGTNAITAMSVLSDGEMIVGDGSGDPVAESGATLRTSIGVGTGDSPQFTAIELGHASDTTIARSSAGVVTVEGNAIPTLANGSDNRVITASSASAMNGEANLTFDGSALTVAGTVAVGSDGSGHDVTFFGDTAGAKMVWDESANQLVITAATAARPLHLTMADGNNHMRMTAADDHSNSIEFINASGNAVYCGMFGDQTSGAGNFGVYNGGFHLYVDSNGTLNLPTANVYISNNSGHTLFGSDGNSQNMDFAVGTSATFSFNARVNINADAAINNIYLGGGGTNDKLSQTSSGSGNSNLWFGNAQLASSSDVRLKKDITDTTFDALGQLNKCRVVDFIWDDPSDLADVNKNSRGKWTGLIAQEVVEHIPFAVNAVRDKDTNELIPDAKVADDDGNLVNSYWGLEYDKIVPVLIKAVQDLSAKVTALENG